LHRFLASLTDTRWKMEGMTVLYIPKEGSSMDIDVASKNKELVQRLDSIFIFKSFRIIVLKRSTIYWLVRVY
jgi:dynein heavy chain